MIRFGILGAARIAPYALIKPARLVDGVRVTGIAARDETRAAAFATRWDVPVVHADYAAVLRDPDVDAVYIPLPNSLHARWTLAAIEAGKHVLCEKPMASNAAEARRLADAATVAATGGLVVMEAFHYRYHPLMTRVLGLLADGAIGAVERIEVAACIPLPRVRDIRYDLSLSGGAMMDIGCYTVHCVRLLGGAEPVVVAAEATLRSPGIDRAMSASLRFPSGVAARIRCSLWSRKLLDISIKVTGSAGQLAVRNFLAPQFPHLLSVRTAPKAGRSRRWVERVRGESTYAHQLRAFAAAVRGGDPVLTPATDAVATMAVIDDVYRAAGLPPRGVDSPPR